MKDARQAIGKLAVAATALSALSATADIKYWDTPAYRAFDVDCYVPGAVWNYDGIRNVGATADHDNDATEWKNLGTDGSTYDTTPVAKGSGSAGEWTDCGYRFKGGTRWYNSASVSVSGSWTVQMLVDADADDQPGSTCPVMSAMGNAFAFWLGKNIGSFYASLNGGKTTPYILTSSHAYDYATVIVNNESLPATATMFSGTKPPTAGNGYKESDTAISGGNTTGWGLGSTNTDGQQMVGILKSFRWYKRVLNDNELVWNRVVDERRFFDRAAPLPVTNAVVVSSVAASTEPAGTYAVDGRHVFTAPRVATVGNAKYICTGYTLEEWDDATGDWGSATFHARELSCKVEDTDCVRITWKWMDADGLVTYDVSDYVWNGLEVFYDGICNQGTNVAHSTTATNWVNLGSTGSDNNVFVQRLNAAGNGWVDAADVNPVGDRDPGYWTDNGFRLDAEGRFRCNAPGGFDVGTSYSLQMLIDAKTSEQVPASNSAIPFGAQVDTFAFQIRKNNKQLQWKCFKANYPYMEGDAFDYMTAIMRAEDKQTFFDGTVEPTSGTGCKANVSTNYSDTGFCLGGYTKSNVSDLFVGTLKSFRQYDHALTPAEVLQNRKVDDFRYFGKFAETDVIVQSTYAALQGNEPDGEYDVDGSHTFTAPANVTIKVNGKEFEYACDGYTVETWGALADKGDGWSAATHFTGNSYAYSETAGKVRLTWKWKATRGLRTAADYSFADYSQAGIVWNFDGIYNQGVGVVRSTTATTWKNLAPNPVTPELFVQRINSARNNYDNSSALSSLEPVGDRDPGEWTEDGFRLKGDSRWRGLGQVGPVANWTLQTLVDADVADVVNDIMYVISVSWPNFAVVLRKNNNVANSFHFNVQDTQGYANRPYIQNASGKYDYATAILDSSDSTAKMFQGVTPPVGGTIADGYYQFSSPITPFKDTNFGFGASTSYTEYFIGTMKSIRYYDRVLTEEEIVRNRNVDAVRYFGALGVTNVFVVAGGGTQAETGAYKVEGEWTFSATTVDKDGVLKPVKGFYTQTLENGQLSRRVWHDGDTFKYSEDDPITGGKTVHLTWAFGQPGMCIILR